MGALHPFRRVQAVQRAPAGPQRSAAHAWTCLLQCALCHSSTRFFAVQQGKGCFSLPSKLTAVSLRTSMPVHCGPYNGFYQCPPMMDRHGSMAACAGFLLEECNAPI